jgi:hypothetical protein
MAGVSRKAVVEQRITCGDLREFRGDNPHGTVVWNENLNDIVI